MNRLPIIKIILLSPVFISLGLLTPQAIQGQEASSTPTPPAVSSDTVVSFDYPEANIKDVVQAISKLTGKNFILDPNVRGKISIISPSPVTVEEAYRAFLSALAVNKVSIVPAGKYLKVMRQREAASDSTQIFGGSFTPTTDNFITRILHLKYISAEDLQRSLRDLTTREAQIIAYGPTNTLIITDTGSNIHRLLEIIKLLDVSGFEEHLEVIPLQYASASDIAKILDDIFEQGGQSRGFGSRGRRSFRRSTRRLGQSAGGRKGSASISKIIPHERTNSLIVLANDAGIERIKEVLTKLDIEIKGAGKIHVYYLQNSNAEDVSETLSALISGAQAATRGGRPPLVRGGIAVGSVGAFEGGVRIQANKSTNSLVITASPQDFQTIKKVIQQLDIPRKQVFVEAYILEVRLNKEKNVGISYLGGIPLGKGGGIGTLLSGLSSGGTDIFDAITDPTTLKKKGGILGFFSKGAGEFETPDGKKLKIPVGALIKLLQKTGQVDLLSAPQVLTLDNEEAEFKVGEKIPTVGQTTLAGSSQLSQQSIEDKDIFLSLKVKPQINETSKFVRLKIEQEINALSTATVPTQLQNQSVATTQRLIKTTVVVQDAKTVVLGGLIKDDIEETENKIPFLGDIPLIGWLFKDSEKKINKNNILIFITPHVIHNENDFKTVFNDQLKERERFIHKFNFKETKATYINKFNPPGEP